MSRYIRRRARFVRLMPGLVSKKCQGWGNVSVVRTEWETGFVRRGQGVKQRSRQGLAVVYKGQRSKDGPHLFLLL